MSIYDDYVWRLSSTTPAFDVKLPQDLTWVDEVTWSPVQQKIQMTLSGAIVVQESYQHRGRPISLFGKDQMGWIDRGTLETLLAMTHTHSLVMRLQYIEYLNSAYTSNILLDYDVMFRHYDPPVFEADSIKGFDEFDPEAWFALRGLKFMQVTENAVEPCSASSLLQVSLVNGTFNPSNIITGDTSGATGTVLSFDGVQLYIYKTGITNFSIGEVIRVDELNYATIDSIG